MVLRGYWGENCNKRLPLHLSRDIYDVSQNYVSAEHCAKSAMSDVFWVTAVVALQFPVHYTVQ